MVQQMKPSTILFLYINSTWKKAVMALDSRADYYVKEGYWFGYTSAKTAKAQITRLANGDPICYLNQDRAPCSNPQQSTLKHIKY